MSDSRRSFFKSLGGAFSSLLLLQSQSSPPIPGPRRRTPVDPPAPAEKQDTDNTGGDAPKSLQRARLQAQEKEFRETMARLAAKVNDLKTRVEGLRSTDVFSVAVFKETQEIEKLAKQLKNSAKP